MTLFWTISTSILALSSAPSLVRAVGYAACSSVSPCKLKVCNLLPVQSATACSLFFSQHDISASTCVSQPTVYVTSTVQPTVTIVNSEVETSYVTSTALFQVLTTATVTATSVPTTTVTSSITVVSTETETITSSIPTFPWAGSCTRSPKLRRDIIRSVPDIPKDCSCYLTNILSAKPTTVTATTYLPAITTFLSDSSSVTVGHLVKETITHILISTTIINITTTIVVPSTITSVVATSVTTTATHIGIPEVCNDPYTFNGRNAFVYSGTVEQPVLKNSDLTSCCTICYQTHSCASFVWKPSTAECLIYLADSQTDLCFNDYCPNGRSNGFFMPDPDVTNQYCPGPCGGGIVR